MCLPINDGPKSIDMNAKAQNWPFFNTSTIEQISSLNAK